MLRKILKIPKFDYSLDIFGLYGRVSMSASILKMVRIDFFIPQPKLTCFHYLPSIIRHKPRIHQLSFKPLERIHDRKLLALGHLKTCGKAIDTT